MAYNLQEHQQAAQNGGYFTVPDSGYEGQPGWAPGSRQWIPAGSPTPGQGTSAFGGAPNGGMTPDTTQQTTAVNRVPPTGGVNIPTTSATPTSTTPAAPAAAPSVVDSWVTPAVPVQSQQAQGVVGQLAADGSNPATQDRSNQLYDTLFARINQNPTDVSNNPAIRAQSDAYRANEERAQRDFLGDQAESQGPYANLGAERRLAAENLGQRSGAYEAQLIGQEIQNRRDEVQSALTQAGGQLTADQQRRLQEQLAVLDNALAQQQLQQGNNAQQLQSQSTLLQNEQFGRDLGLRAEDRAAYYDAVRQGLFR